MESRSPGFVYTVLAVNVAATLAFLFTRFLLASAVLEVRDTQINHTDLVSRFSWSSRRCSRS